MATHKTSELPVIRKGNDIFNKFNQIQDMIRERAYSIFHERYPSEGDAVSDWFRAESELLADADLKIEDKDDQVLVEGNIADFQPDEIEIKAEQGVFKIGGVHSEKSSEQKAGGTRTSTRQKYFYKCFNLPESVDTEKMEVKLKSGKFTVRIPKTTH